MYMELFLCIMFIYVNKNLFVYSEQIAFIEASQKDRYIQFLLWYKLSRVVY